MIVWAHGLEGAPNGAKVQALRGAGWTVVAPDGRGKVLADRLPAIEAALTEAPAGPLILAGSSYGGLAAAWLATRWAPRLSGLLLCAPALHHREPPLSQDTVLAPPLGLTVRIVHGVQDQVVPLSASQDYAVRGVGPLVELVEVEDGHRLANSLARIVEQAAAMGSPA